MKKESPVKNYISASIALGFFVVNVLFINQKIMLPVSDILNVIIALFLLVTSTVAFIWNLVEGIKKHIKL